MRKRERLFQIPISEARECVEPEELEAVLPELVEAGFFSKFEVTEHYLFIWSAKRLDAVMFGAEHEAKCADLTPAQRRPSSRKKAS